MAFFSYLEGEEFLGLVQLRKHYMLNEINFIVDSFDSGFLSYTVSEDEHGPLTKDER